jgi:hypothetical protein
MRYRLAGIALLPVLVALAAAPTLDTTNIPTLATPTDVAAPSDPEGLVAHEWGTFTSIADRAGNAIEWLQQNGPADLPCFVNRLRMGPKSTLMGTVRMETPVIYFYAPAKTTVSVKVRFPKGAISEWYPQATVTPASTDQAKFARPDFEGTIAWPAVTVAPGTSETFKTEAAKNHYYAARATEAAPVTVGSEREKFLFYRGIGRFEPPIRAMVRTDGKVDVSSRVDQPLGDLVLFENRGGAISFQVARASGATFTFDVSSSRGKLDSLYASLEQLLVSAGLYPKEAAAMVETWRDSWFEEGSRLLYIVPKPAVDRILPLEITPRPKSVARVFVGRVELLTARTLDDVKTAVERGDRAQYLKYGRFFNPIVDRIMADSNVADGLTFSKRLQIVWQSWPWNSVSCR